MPESVTDRPTKSHEYLFLFSKSARYYYDAEAIAEEAEKGSAGSNFTTGKTGVHGLGRASTVERVEDGKRNKRTVWSVPTVPFAGAHFAVYPPELIRPCIRAGSRPIGKRCDCEEVISTPRGNGATNDPTMLVGRAGMNRHRRADEGRRAITRRVQRGHAMQIRASEHRAQMESEAGPAFEHYVRLDRSGARPLPQHLIDAWTERGWLTAVPPCTHPNEPADIVLDPFSGSGTTGAVATFEGRRYVGIDLNREYLDLSLQTRFQQPALPWGAA